MSLKKSGQGRKRESFVLERGEPQVYFIVIYYKLFLHFIKYSLMKI